MRPDDLVLLRTPGTPAVSPDGRVAVAAVARVDPASGALLASLMAVPTDASGPARALTTGTQDSDPAFSPDGRWLAYLSAAAGAPPQLHLLPTAGGAARRLTDLPLGAGRPVWAPDSRRLAWAAPVRLPDVDGGPRLLTAVPLRRDGFAFPVEHRHQLHVLALPEELPDGADGLPVVVQVTSGDVDSIDVCWSPDGTELAFVSARHDGYADDLGTDVYAVAPDGSGLRRVTVGDGRCARPAWSLEGDGLYVAMAPGADGGSALCRVTAGGGTPEPVPGLVGNVVLGPLVTPDGVLVGVARDGAVELLRVSPSGGEPQRLVDGPFRVRGVGVAGGVMAGGVVAGGVAAGGVVVAAVGHDGSAGELLAITPGRRRLLSGFGRRLAETGRVHRARERVLARPGGDLRGWLTVPAGPGPHPVLLRLAGSAGWLLTEDVQVAVTAGYALLDCAPVGDVALALSDAALALLDDALADGTLDLDGGRVGLLGGAAAAALLSGDRFTAAVVDLAPDSAPDSAPDAAPDAAPARGITVPTLVVADEVGPGSAARLLYVSLRERDVPAELLLLPGGAGGRMNPANRAARLEHLLRWFGRWLGPTDAEESPKNF